MQQDQIEIQQGIIKALGVATEVDPLKEVQRRVAFLRKYLTQSAMRTLVLGISGGVDSTTAGRLAQLAVQEMRHGGYEAKFIAMRLPYGVQRDEADAQRALDFIQPDQTCTVNIQAAANAALEAVLVGGFQFRDAAHRDFILGNIKARQRMVAQYAVAGGANGLVIGTDHAAEALMGFFTKFGDGACDIAPLAGLSKRQVRSVAKALGAPADLIEKVPTADLENLSPQKPDELAFGMSYDEIDDFLEGKPVTQTAFETILRHYRATAHKRALPVVPD